MKLWLVVPVKALDASKSRLAAVLSAPERADLMRTLLQRLLQAAQETNVLAGVVVVSRDPAVQAIAEGADTCFLFERGHDLNAALDQARDWVITQGAEAILVLPADLPWVTAADIDELARLGPNPPCMVIAPSRDRGTGALLLHPPHAINFAFGNHSFDRHCALAQAQHLSYVTYHSPNLAFDVDRPEDWAILRAVTKQTR